MKSCSDIPPQASAHTVIVTFSDGWLTVSSSAKRQVEQNKTQEINSIMNERKQIVEALKTDAKMGKAHKNALSKQVVLSTGETLHFVKEGLQKKLKVTSTEEAPATNNQNQFTSHLSQNAAEDSGSIGNEKALAVVVVGAEQEEEKYLEEEEPESSSSNVGETTSVETSIVANSKDDNCNNKQEDVAPSPALPICSKGIENYGSLVQDESNDNVDGHDEAEEEDVVWTYMQDINEALEGWDVDEFATEEAEFDFQSIFIQPTE
ncbi:unnamed protein product [Allacma fusca]|uniref:Uncharacterized protein n=1 Tax=Allacma fusca TaxID=39272 RepID=A0A8J2KRI1_9HEXA|nr:unnamed protein product [Allacma fusca]